MATQKSLSLPHRVESPHPPLSDPSHLMTLLSAIVLILLRTVNGFGNEVSVSNYVTSQFIGHGLPRLNAMCSQ